ncbi:MAG: hypothetical protein QW622_01500 [Candidatus Pacearchaeota archaeon]
MVRDSEDIREAENKIRDIINNIEIMVVDEKIDPEAADELKDQLKELAGLLGV